MQCADNYCVVNQQIDRIIPVEPVRLDVPSDHVKLSQRSDFREFFDYLDGVAMWTAEGEGSLTYLSPGFEDLWGVPADEILEDPRRLLEDVHPDDRERVQARIEQPGEEVSKHALEHRVLQPDGTVRWVEARVFPIHDPDGGFSELIGITVDVTERKRRELELEILNRVLRHDIRNDMSVVLGWLDLLEDAVSDDDEILDRIRTASQHVVELTNIARAYLDIIVDNGDLDLEPVDVSAVLTAELESRRLAYPDATVEVDGKLTAVTVEANELLASVFRNLLNNAVQHSDEDSPSVVVAVHDDPETVRIRVADDGPGVPDEQKETVFGKADAGPESPGTGMGLYLCREIVGAFDGRIWVDDNEPEGAVFCVELPRRG